MSHAKQSATEDLDHLLTTMRREIEADQVKMKHLMETEAVPKPAYKPKFVQKLQRLVQAASDMERRKDASRLRRQRELLEIEQITLPKRSKSTGSFTRRSGSVEDRLQSLAKASVLKRERIARMTLGPEELLHSPEICPTSELIVQRTRDPKEKIEDRLLRLGKQIEAAKKTKVHGGGQSPRRLHTTSSEVTERLMQYQQIYRDHRLLLKQEHLESPTWRPVINKKSGLLASKFRRNAQSPKAVQSSRPLLEEYSFKPQTNKRSLILAKKLAPSRERLLSPRRAVESSLVPECTFQPSTNTSRSPSGSARWKALYELNMKNLEKKAQMQVEARAKAESMTECTFKPAIIPLPKEADRPLLSRLLDWDLEKRTKLSQEREKKDKQGLEECTFTPNVRPRQFYAAKDWKAPSAPPKPSSRSLTYSAPLDPLVVETRETMQRVDEDSGELSRILSALEEG